jgi:hypothetical protein
MNLSLCMLLLLAADSTGKPALPGKAKWDLAPLERLFRIVKTDVGESGKTVRWTFALREGVRTADFARALQTQPFTFLFLDAENNEVGRVKIKKDDFQGISKERIMKAGTPLTLTLDIPAAIDKATKVRVRRGKVD